ncbi:5-formyltetrahydrofolate cyclo-ligase [Sphingomonas sp. BT-65]|uniref:5-formyltetrahydrofolate cyclo-ligase n=1 Tax=Sphingomonas sp. BT-65 TaxID=2989821 RepID=UPI002235ED6E|nr:5-formyltetrahydrofolate cyclo-ligase [Sphingomonas sp. BT-65]MCW4461155.1 5-formyltetrahydrofolate cyclo-ligase [Sphingomonas sp. BT-65]
MDDKRTLRARMRALRDEFAMTIGGVIEPPPALLARFAPGVTVSSYVPVGSEADPTAIAFAARERGCAIVLPHVTSRESPVRFFHWTPEHPLIDGPLGLRQPSDDGVEAEPDIVLTPLLAFDGAMNRLGQGAGHYDRVFERLPDAWRIGIAWSVQQVEGLVTDSWDVPLHGVVTEAAAWGEAAA